MVWIVALLAMALLGASAYIVYLRQTIFAKSKMQIEAQAREITDLRQQIASIETDSTQSKALFSVISGVAYDYVLVLDQDKTIIAHNHSADILFPAQNPVGEQLADVVDAPELHDIVNRAIDEGEEQELEDQFVINKNYYRARIRVKRYDNGKHFIGIAMQDITQLVRLNRARRDMVANISHELRTPITKIRFIIDSLFHEQNKPKRKASIASMRSIAHEIGALEDVVQELLDLSMIESGQAIMKLVDEPLAPIVEIAVTRLEEKLTEKGISIVRHIPQKLRVLCEPEHIRRVITNLISNAIKWSPDDDAITISATIHGEDVVISVFDNGPGVPDDQRERIFERFYQVDTARSGKDGSGLGLAISKHIVVAHGGKIWAEGNSQGNGGRFLFTLANTTPQTDTDDYMDRGQHDFVWKPTARPPLDDDDDHIVFYDGDEDEFDDDDMDSLEESHEDVTADSQ